MQEGYFIARQLAPMELREQLLAATIEGLGRSVGPVEYEADLSYPGAPDSHESAGGQTIRRLKQAHSRHAVFTEWAAFPGVATVLRAVLGPEIVMPLAHHNCVMTKMPSHSSDTGWHQDIRYWGYERPELVSVWLALGDETQANGCLQLLPGTHRNTVDRERLDEELFLRADLPENQALINRRIFAELAPGDVLFFHARTFHAASRNHTADPKFSVVFTYRPANNPPLPGSRSASMPELLIPKNEGMSEAKV